MTYEGLRLKVLKFKRKTFANLRKRQLNSTDFTIISNNCWGGMIYESYNLPKGSPTVGMFFMAVDFIKFISNLREYLNSEIAFISPEKSKWKDQVCCDKRFGHYPIGILNDIEIFFLHYHNEQEAKEKWEDRCQRVNWDKLIIKFNDQNGCTLHDVENFMSLPFKNKLFFTCKSWSISNAESVTVIRQYPKNDFIMASFEPFGSNRYINITELLNSI